MTLARLILVTAALGLLAGCGLSTATRAGIHDLAQNAADLDAATAPGSGADPVKVHALAVQNHAVAVGVATECGVPTGTAAVAK
jgi:hypothetical protein